MRRLREREEDEYLDWGQQQEEALGTVQHDVWVCGPCAERVTKSYGAWLHTATVCSGCGYKTIAVNRVTLESATRFSTGLEEITQSCVACDYEVTWEEVIPRLPNPDDDDMSSSSSWSAGGGGGSSGGGGATGSW